MDDIKKDAKSADMLKKNQKKKDSPSKGKGRGFDPNFRYPGHPSYQSGRGRGYHPYANNDYFRGGQPRGRGSQGPGNNYQGGRGYSSNNYSNNYNNNFQSPGSNNNQNPKGQGK